MIIAGEASGDRHGAKLVTAMRQRHTDLCFWGVGGGALKAAGVHILVDAATLAVVGITEVIAKLSSLTAALRTVKDALRRLKPDLLILIDFPDFNLHLAAFAKKIGIPVLYYISPQIWAWRPGRVKKIKRRVDHMAVILPFEADFYRRHDVPVTFVGHPLLDTLAPPRPDTSRVEPVVGLLPGSRDGEVLRHLPVMLSAARLLRKQLPGYRFLVSVAPGLDLDMVSTLVQHHAGALPVEIVTGGAGRILSRCCLAVAVSGTVTLEAAISGTPTVIIYRVSALSYGLGRLLVRVDNIGLVNLIAGRRLCPELIQKQATAGNIARTLCAMLRDREELQRLSRRLFDLRARLGGPGASRRVADIACQMLYHGTRSQNRIS